MGMVNIFKFTSQNERIGVLRLPLVLTTAQMIPYVVSSTVAQVDSFFMS